MKQKQLEFALDYTPVDGTLIRLRTWVRTARQKRNWTQAEVARRSGVPPATISRLEMTGLASTDALFAVLEALELLKKMDKFLSSRLPRPPSEPSLPRYRVRMKK